jgi:hypothetical protein
LKKLLDKVKSENNILDLTVEGRILSFKYVMNKFDGKIIKEALKHNQPNPSSTQQVIKLIVAHSLGPITYWGGPFALAFTYVALASGCDLNVRIPQLIVELSLIPEESYIEEIRQLLRPREVYTQEYIIAWKTVDDNVLTAWKSFELKVLQYGSANRVDILQPNGNNVFFCRDTNTYTIATLVYNTYILK